MASGEDVFLTGSSHFGFGFVLGSIVMLLLIRFNRANLAVQLYAPFLPFIVGALAAVPYTFLDPSLCQPPSFYNIFFLYSFIHCHSLASALLGSLNLVAIVCGVIYCLILFRYILLVKHVRRHGWIKREKR